MLPFDQCRWLVEGENVENVHGALVEAQSVFDQQTFAEAVGITANAIARARIACSQEILVTPRGLGRIILRHSLGEEIRWWPTIGLCRSRKVRGYGDYL